VKVLDSFRLDGKVGLITGGSRGLGLQLAEALGEAGATVAITARREPGLVEAEQQLGSRGIRTLALRCDVASAEEVQVTVAQVRDRLGGIDILVNNAGATWGAPLAEITDAAWARVVRTNVDGTFYVSRAVALGMIERGQGGRIINIASVAGLRGSDPRVLQTLPYNTSKGAVVNFTRDLAVKLAEHQITVNCICPGFFPTRMSAGVLREKGELIKAATPLGRFGSDQDLKGLAVLLASPASAFITGQVIAVDGGATAL
jgi:NAD(P)-dependent dehydrogenase (short-subunit alcohol dehydrogenase family)